MTDRPARKPSPSPPRGRFDDWTAADYDDHGWPARLGHRYLVRRRRRRARVKAMPRGKRVLRRLMILGTWFLGLVAAMMVAVIVAYFAFTDVPRPEDLPSANQQAVTIEYADGSQIAKIGVQDRTIVALDRVPESTRWAVLAAEDRNFYSDGAVSITGTLRAAAVDVTGGERQGGSGITQQYVKNAYLNADQTLTRKLKELMIAVKLSREYSKDEILGFYLNTVYFGRGAYGIEAAAETFFGVDVSKLTVAQGALLAAMLRAPSYYDPAVNPTQAKGRWDYVVQGMVTTGHLSAAQAATLAFPKTKAPDENGLGASGWKYLLVNAVLDELSQHGIDSDEVYRQGLVVRTTLDPRAQQAALTAVSTVLAHPTAKQTNLKSALVAVNPANGGVLAYYPGTGPGVKGLDGKVDYNDWAQQNANAPGSSFKPIVLATVLQQTVDQKPGDGKIHYAINSLVDGSSPQTIGGTVIHNDPSDDEAGYSRPNITIAFAMRHSLNTTFDWLAVQADPDNVAAMAHKLGVAAVDSRGRKTLVGADGSTSFGIGIGDYPATTLDMASAYSVFADDGMRSPTHLVQQATASDGSVVYSYQNQSTRVIDARVANDVTLTLEQVAGDAGLALSGGRVAAAKTGTAGVSGTSTNNSDAWMVGYTPQVSAAVWLGTGAKQPIYNSAGQPMYGRNEPGEIWNQFMNGYLSAIRAPNLPMATRQLLSAAGTTAASPSPTPSRSPSRTPSSSPPPTPSDSRSSSVAPSKSSTPSTSATRSPTSSSAPPSPANTCGILHNAPCLGGG